MDVPQPAVERLVPFAGHPAVVGVVPGQPELVVRTALAWAQASATALHLAYVDTQRYVVEEHADGSVRHAALDPDTSDDGWQRVERELREQVAAVVGTTSVPWTLHYLAGRPDRALTHLARAVDAAVIVVGTRAPGAASRFRELVEGSVAVHLAHHQHRPVLTVPLGVVDWSQTRSPW
ncbi:universal stress protein [Cellulomonas fulva]|uniref:universal stress protein n=1 Tax=Cellulomonas fulva TaxID=2835530 RepID=UPI0027DE6E11|nr:universal stress protein [Cellulomonas fulva]